MGSAVSNRSRLAFFALLSLFVAVGLASQSAAGTLTVNFAITGGDPQAFPSMPNPVTGGAASFRFPTASGPFAVAVGAPMTMLALSLSTAGGGTFHLGSVLQGTPLYGTVTPALSLFSAFFPCAVPCGVTGSVGNPSQNTSISLHSITGSAKGPPNLARTFLSLQIFPLVAGYGSSFVQGNEINRVFIPEPGSFGLFALGVTGMGMVAGGRRSRLRAKGLPAVGRIAQSRSSG